VYTSQKKEKQNLPLNKNKVNDKENSFYKT